VACWEWNSAHSRGFVDHFSTFLRFGAWVFIAAPMFQREVSEISQGHSGQNQRSYASRWIFSLQKQSHFACRAPGLLFRGGYSFSGSARKTVRWAAAGLFNRPVGSDLLTTAVGVRRTARGWTGTLRPQGLPVKNIL